MNQQDLEQRLREQVAETERLAARRERDMAERTVLDETLLRMLPLVHEANMISNELGKGMRFAVKLVAKATRGWDIHTFVNSDEIFTNLSPNSSRDRRIRYSNIPNLN